MQTDTIAAVSTGLVQAGIGIIRISGSDAIAAADRIFRTPKGRKASELEDHKLSLGYIVTASGEKELCYDQVMLCVMHAPRSYTGEDTVEINCHGGIWLCEKILALVLENGVRPAEPGEFTKRAFLNGRMDLTQAEAVMDLIASKNEFARRNAMEHLSGALKSRIGGLREKLLHEMAYIEASLDDPEHYDLEGYAEELADKTKDFLKELDAMLRNSENGRIRKDGIKTVILGKPNAGKSSLLNLLTGQDTAIVTEIAGTTRDMVEESVRLGRLQLNLVDTAGIRNTGDPVEKIGVGRALKAAENADLILYVTDSSTALDENDRRIAALLSGREVVVLYNKCDLTPVTTREEITALLKNTGVEEDIAFIEISAREGSGLEKLKERLEEIYLREGSSCDDEVIITGLRQITELKKTKESLEKVLQGVADGMPEDMIMVDLTDAYRHLGYIIGEQMGDDLTDRIFSEFCMGK